MNNLTIVALVLVVVVLLYVLYNGDVSSCRLKKPDGYFYDNMNNNSSEEGMSNDYVPSITQYELPSYQISDVGSGVEKRREDLQYEDLKDNVDLMSSDYNDTIKYMSLEPEVFNSHKGYVNDIGITNRGASSLTVRSDPNDIVPWRGLRRPDYYSVYAQADARQQPSEFADQMEVNKPFVIY